MTAMRTVRGLLMVFSGLVATVHPADAWHRHRYARYLTIRPAGTAAPSGYHCPLGEYWRPSLRICQAGPYRGSQRQVTSSGPGPEVQSNLDENSPSPPGRVMSMDTRVVDRRRSVTRDGVTLTYTVRTRVTERYPAGDRRRR